MAAPAAARADLTPGIPRIESPLFDDLFDSDDPDIAIARRLRDDGFAVLDFPDDGFDAMAERVKAALAPGFDIDRWRTGGGDLRVQDAWRDVPDVRRIACDETILALLGRLYGRRAFPFQTLNFPVGTEQHYHSDSIHFSAMPERFMCGVWVALEDIGEDQGPLLYYPGSHRWPVWRNEHVGHRHRPGDPGRQEVFHPAWERLVELHGIEPVRFTPRKGQALIWTANLLHGGSPHHDRARTRWSQVTHYYFEGCAYYTPMLSNEARGEYCLREPFDILTGGTERSLGRGAPPVPGVAPPPPPEPRRRPLRRLIGAIRGGKGPIGRKTVDR